VFKNEIRQLIKEVKKKYFRTLIVFVVFTKKRSYYMAAKAIPLGIGILFVDRSCKKMPSKAIIGILVHEFCHLKKDRYWFWNHTQNAVSKQEDERLIDMEVIKLGYGENLLAFHKWHNKKYKRYTKKDGLTASQIERILLKGGNQ
jgi:predicted SprT family Zn-dependent metalloprotease